VGHNGKDGKREVNKEEREGRKEGRKEETEQQAFVNIRVLTNLPRKKRIS
jgi:hypothetical protein